MFDLMDRPQVWIPVSWPELTPGEDGGIAVPIEQEIEVFVELVDKDKVREMYGLDTSGEQVSEGWDVLDIAKAVASDWRKIRHGGKPVPFSAEMLEKWIARPNVSRAFAQAYMMAIGGKVKVREGNSVNSLSRGRADEVTAGMNGAERNL